jgi:hypothetical protein
MSLRKLSLLLLLSTAASAQTAISGVSVHATDIRITMNHGSTNSPQVRLDALTSAGSDTLEPGIGCTGWNQCAG